VTLLKCDFLFLDYPISRKFVYHILFQHFGGWGHGAPQWAQSPKFLVFGTLWSAYVGDWGLKVDCERFWLKNMIWYIVLVIFAILKF
jgi:hypothetical protein